MALKLKDGRYVKLDLENCYIDIRGVHVGYIVYSNVKNKNSEQTANSKLNELLLNITKYTENCIAKLKEKLGNINEFKSHEELMNAMDEEDIEIYEKMHSVEEDRNMILIASQIGDKTAEKKLKNLNLLKELGYSEEVLDGTLKGVPMNNISGVFTGQKLNYSEMYKELKKLFKKDGYEDC